MKFHCDRCKTRYSIADERVRGKILKIRCKNCSTVLTVKEGGQHAQPSSSAATDAARPARAATSAGQRKRAGSKSGVRRRPTTSSGSALQGAFEEALRRPESAAAVELAAAPAVLEAEWYVSQDGDQVGPFALARAQEWVAERGGDEELFCWSEGFDDWLPVEKVSHFRGLRAGRPASGLLAMPPGMSPRSAHGADEVEETLLHSTAGIVPAREETPVPLFAATLAQVTADAPADEPSPRRNGSSSPHGPTHGQGGRAPSGSPPGGGSLFGPALAAAGPVGANGSNKPGETGPDLSHDFEIGEASRVVRLPMLARQAGNGDASPLGAPGLPGMGAAPSGGASASSLGRGTGSHDQGARAASALPVIHGGGTLDLPRSEVMAPRRRSSMVLPIGIGAAAVLGVVSVLLFVALSDGGGGGLVRRGEVGGRGGLAYTFDDEDGDKKPDKPTETAKAPARKVPRKTSSAGKSAPSLTGTRTQGPVAIGPDEVDLSGGPAGELDPDDLFDVYSANKIGVTMCYNSALKRDPLLSVRRADVVISVSPSGVVASVSIPALSGTPLGACLEKRIKSWRFPRASRVFNSRFPIIFQT